jgi:MSHA biogenesis protein MshJ
MTLRTRLYRLGEKINGFSLRERALLMLAAFAVIFLLWDVFAMRPITERQQHIQGQLNEVRDRVTTLTVSIQQLATERGRDPNAELTARRDQLETEIHALGRRLAEAHGGIATPRQSVAILAGLLAERSGVEVVELENLPVEPLYAEEIGQCLACSCIASDW